ncbi:MAG: TatD family hydrolase [Zetaproteobacteria bacterium]|nr:TatD family hydrolase [Zetaproteobacteria bacterium]
MGEVDAQPLLYPPLLKGGFQGIVDSHCHLDDLRFEGALPSLLHRAGVAGLDHIIVPCSKPDRWGCVSPCETMGVALHLAYAIHPWYCEGINPETYHRLACYLEHAVAVGECGLDLGARGGDLAEQVTLLRNQLILADHFHLPVILHAHKALDMLWGEVRNFPALRGVVHSFSGSFQQAKQWVDHGFYLGVGARVTYANQRRFHAMIAAMPASALLLESDAPDQSPQHWRGKNNEPALIVETIRALAALRNVAGQALVDQCRKNSQELFKI